jgi:hypothetical protein
MEGKIRKRPDDDIGHWVQGISDRFDFPMRQVSPDHLQLGMRGKRTGPYTLNIKKNGPRVSYGTRLTHAIHEDVDDKSRAGFLEDVLELNGRMNDVRLGMQEGSLTLTREDPKEDLTPHTFGRSILMMHGGREQVLPEILKKAQKRGIRFKKE